MTDAKLEVTYAKKADVDAIISIMNLSFQDEFRFTGFDPERIRKMAKFMLSPLGKIALFFMRKAWKTEILAIVGKSGGVPVAFTMVTARKGRAYISSVAVHPEHRRLGHARTTLNSAIDEARVKCKQAVLHVSTANAPARSLYRSLGFERFETNSMLAHENLENVAKLEMKGDEAKVSKARRSDKKRMFELLKSSNSQSHNETTPTDVRQIGSSIFMSGESAYLVYRDCDTVLGFASPFVPKMRVSSMIRQLAVSDNIDGALRAVVARSLIHACAKWMTERKAMRCTITIEDWSNTHDIVEAIKSMGFTEGLRMEGMVLRLED